MTQDDHGTGPALYGFAARGIQDYLFRSEPLRDIVGASEIVESLPDLFDRAAAEWLGKEEGAFRVLTRAAGGVRVWCRDGRNARELALGWPLLAAQHAPGLELVQAVVGADGRPFGAVLNDLETRLAIRRNQPVVVLPEAGPLAERSPHTGLPAAGSVRIRRGGSRSEDRLVDAETARKLQVFDSAHQVLLRRLMGGDIGRVEDWPRDFERIAGPDGGYLAILHADGNGMGRAIGELIRSLSDVDADQAMKVYAGFSRIISDSTRLALQKAVQAVRGDAPYPVRPIVCAGDDVTVVARADVAFRLAEIFLKELSAESSRLLEAEGIRASPVTATAGIVCVRCGYPFRRAYDLVESMLGEAKKAGGRSCSALAFTRVTTEVTGRYADMVKREMTSRTGRLTQGVYRVDGGSDGTSPLPSWRAMRQLADALGSLPRGSARGTVRAMYESREASNRAFQRMCDVAAKPKAAAVRSALESLTGNRATPLWNTADTTPFYDALELNVIEGGERTGEPEEGGES